MHLSRCGTCGLVITALLIALLSGIPVFAESSAIPVDQCGQVLNEPGEYILTGALDNEECPSTTCSAAGGAITITASNLHLDTAGHSINAICAAVAVADGVSNVRIDGGGFLRGGNGVTIGKDRNVVVSGLGNIHGDPDLGGNEVGIMIDGGDDITVTNNHIEGVIGIYALVNNGTFSNNTIFGLGIVNQGIVLVNAQSSSMTTVLLRGHHGSSRYNNIIRGNKITPSGTSSDDTGISVMSNRNLVQGNTIDQAGAGISLSGDANKVVNNDVTGGSPPSVPQQSAYGIFTARGASRNVIVGNAVSDDQADMHESNGPPCVNRWQKNRFQTSSGAVACIH
jgi:hypothetical protein